MELNDVQKRAVNEALNCEFIYSITGSAGTGKSTVIAEISRRTELPHEILSPTGRAADLLRKKIGKGMTIHKFLEYWTPDFGQTYRPKYSSSNQRKDCKLLIIDEASMIDREVWDNLLKSLPDDTKIILVGDKNQLPPIEKVEQKSAFRLPMRPRMWWQRFIMIWGPPAL